MSTLWLNQFVLSTLKQVTEKVTIFPPKKKCTTKNVFFSFFFFGSEIRVFWSKRNLSYNYVFNSEIVVLSSRRSPVCILYLFIQTFLTDLCLLFVCVFAHNSCLLAIRKKIPSLTGIWAHTKNGIHADFFCDTHLWTFFVLCISLIRRSLLLTCILLALGDNTKRNKFHPDWNLRSNKSKRIWDNFFSFSESTEINSFLWAINFWAGDVNCPSCFPWGKKKKFVPVFSFAVLPKHIILPCPKPKSIPSIYLSSILYIYWSKDPFYFVIAISFLFLFLVVVFFLKKKVEKFPWVVIHPSSVVTNQKTPIDQSKRQYWIKDGDDSRAK